jgi:nucleoside-triphosphatase THEP1
MMTFATIKKSNILITGPPGCGKSTLIEKVVNRMEEPVTGFFTREIKEEGRRVGFSITTLDGREGVLAHQNIRSQFRVGKYGVNREDIDSLAVPTMVPTQKNKIIVIDEIAKMECFSGLFKKTLIQALDSPICVIGSIALKGDPFIQRIKERNDVRLVYISVQNRNMLVKKIINYIRNNKYALRQ